METYHSARYPFLYCQTTEEERFIRHYRSEVDQELKFFRWDIIAGFRALVNPNGDNNMWTWVQVGIQGIQEYSETGEPSAVNIRIPAEADDEKILDPGAALDMLLWLPSPSIVFMHDYHKFFEDIPIIRSALNIKDHLISNEKMAVFVSAVVNIPVELSNDITTYDFKMPDCETLDEILKTMCSDNEIDIPEDSKAVVDAMLGLTEEGAKGAISLSLATKGTIDHKVVLDQKAAQLNASGVLTYHTPKETLQDIAGNEQAIEWLTRTVNHPDSKAVAVYGVPGAGKTLTGKVIANVTKRPCLFADLNAARGQFQGDAEGRISMMFKTARAMGRPFIILDEFDKSISGSTASYTDGGVGQRIVQKFLVEWEEQAPDGPFWYLTLNSLDEFITISGGALLRRMDILFFVDLPSEEEASNIAKIWGKKCNVALPDDYDFSGFSGADIAKLARNMNMLGCDVDKARKYLIPASESIGKQIAEIRSKAKSVCMWASEKQQNIVEQAVAKRKVKLGWSTTPPDEISEAA